MALQSGIFGGQGQGQGQVVDAARQQDKEDTEGEKKGLLAGGTAPASGDEVLVLTLLTDEAGTGCGSKLYMRLQWQDLQGRAVYRYAPPLRPFGDEEEEEREGEGGGSSLPAMSCRELSLLGSVHLATTGKVVLAMKTAGSKHDRSGGSASYYLQDLAHVQVFARVDPQTKIEIVKAFQRANRVVRLPLPVLI